MKSSLPAILLIEKDEVTLEIYQRELASCFTVIALLDIQNVMDILAMQSIQAVVIEPEVCAGQGWDFIEALRHAHPGQEIPVIVCTTRDPSKHGPGRDVARYLTKPVLPKELREATLEVLRKKASKKTI